MIRWNVIVQENGTLPQIPAAYRWNYHFDGWFTDPVEGEQITEETVFEEDTTVYAHWTINRPSTGRAGQEDRVLLTVGGWFLCDRK